MKRENLTQKDENVNSQEVKTKSKTLLQHIERVIELAKDSKLNDEFYKKAKRSLRFIEKMMNLTTNQAVMFAIFIEQCDDECIRIKDISNFLDCKNIKTICLMNDIDELEKRRLVRCCRSDNRVKYRVPYQVINSVKQNAVYQPKNTKNITTNELFEHIESLFNEREENELSYEVLISEINTLLEDNPTLAFTKQMAEYKILIDDDDIFLLLILFCHRFINLSDDMVGYHDFEFTFNPDYALEKKGKFTG